MASVSVDTAGRGRTGSLLLAAVTAGGSASHPYARSRQLLSGPDAARNLSDMLHFLCSVHGLYPGVIDEAAERAADPVARSWLRPAAEAFAAERSYISRLAVAAGPVPSTPGAADSDVVVRSQRHAIQMLARSERSGCSLGAAMALMLDWAIVREALDTAARRFGAEIPAFAAMPPEQVEQIADGFAVSPPASRALRFGAEQILVQHHGLWDLLEARAQARTG